MMSKRQSGQTHGACGNLMHLRRKQLWRFGFAVMVACAIRGAVAQPPHEASLIGVWEADRYFGERIDALLVIEGGDSQLVATLHSDPMEVAYSGDELQLSLPDDRGHFRGSRDQDGVRGHWVQPRTSNTNHPYAFPLRFETRGATWRAPVVTLPDRMRWYLRCLPNDGRHTTAFFRNPERNWGLRIGSLRVEAAGDRIRFVGVDGLEALTGTSRVDAATLTLPLPLGGQEALVFHKSDRQSHFYPAQETAAYRYRVPPELGDGWATTSADQVGMAPRQLERLTQSIRDTKIDSLAAPYIHSVLIAKSGKLVFEEYFHGYGRDDVHDTRSAGKSIASMLVGAVTDGEAGLSVDTTITSIFGEAMMEPSESDTETSYETRSAWRRQMTIADALSMQSGLDADDNDANSPGAEDRMQDDPTNRDWVSFALQIPMKYQPGTQTIYASNSVNLAAAAVARATDTWLPNLFAQYLANPLGIERYYFNLDPSGRGYMGGGLRLTPRDQLKLGQVMLGEGVWHGQRVLSKAWVRRSTTPRGSIQEPNDYCLGWWRKSLPFGERQVQAFYAGGNGGQFIVCVPELELVIQISGGNYGHFQVWYRHLTHLIPNHVFPAIRD